jgi:serine/threonine-protein kinase ATR
MSCGSGIDMNCVILFFQGESFAWPERVPFRLTHNMVAAMGPLGVEGMFRRSCEITLRVLRAQSETLMSVLRPFVYDPMVTWRSTSGRPPTRKESVETTNELVCIKMFHKLNWYVLKCSLNLINHIKFQSSIPGELYRITGLVIIQL